MAKVVSIRKFFRAVGKPMTHGKVAVDYLLFPTFTTAQEGVRCSACSKAGYPCLQLAQGKGL